MFHQAVVKLTSKAKRIAVFKVQAEQFAMTKLDILLTSLHQTEIG